MTPTQRAFILRCDRFLMRCRDMIRSAPEHRALIESWMNDAYQSQFFF